MYQLPKKVKFAGEAVIDMNGNTAMLIQKELELLAVRYNLDIVFQLTEPDSESVLPPQTDPDASNNAGAPIVDGSDVEQPKPKSKSK